tara:strand:- start:432 stop:824 length:393 start_codon:yes stop_codon:yes gene_type:complete
MDRLDSANSLLYAAKYYDNPSCTDIIEFYDDLKRFKYIKRLINKYRETGVIKYRLVLNHITLIYNLFGQEPATRLLFFKLDGYHEELVPFLAFLNRLPSTVDNIGLPPTTIVIADIDLDKTIEDILKENI